MFKRCLILLSAVLLCLTTQVRADTVPPTDTINNLLSQLHFDSGLGYDFKTKSFENVDTINIISWKGLAIDLGYSSADSFIAGISYDGLPTLEKFGVTLPLLKQVGFSPFVAYGWGHLNLQDVAAAKNGVIIGAKLITLKF